MQHLSSTFSPMLTVKAIRFAHRLADFDMKLIKYAEAVGLGLMIGTVSVALAAVITVAIRGNTWGEAAAKKPKATIYTQMHDGHKWVMVKSIYHGRIVAFQHHPDCNCK
tara:strand:+ start:265 stop:591 length:327 start_codon:yes stop_codon:yes gene_type:complete